MSRATVPIRPLPLPFYPQNFSALLFIKPVPLCCSSLTLQTKWGYTQQAYGGRGMCARLHLVINAQRRVLKRWQCARAEDEVIIVAMLRGGGVVCIPDSFPRVWCVCHLHFLSYFCILGFTFRFSVLQRRDMRRCSLFQGTQKERSRYFSISFQFQVRCIGSYINN